MASACVTLWSKITVNKEICLNIHRLIKTDEKQPLTSDKTMEDVMGCHPPFPQMDVTERLNVAACVDLSQSSFGV